MGVEHLAKKLDEHHIFNMDETPVYIDMISSTTLEFKGGKNVNGASTGHEKSRFTVAITTSASGKMLKGYVIFKGLKNIPTIKLYTIKYCSQCLHGWIHERRAYA